MSWLKYIALFLLAGSAHADGQGFLIGGGVETDTDDGIRGIVIAGLGIGEKSWLSGSASLGSVVLGNGRDSNTVYGDLEFDHHFDPVGIRLGVAYWGDPDTLDSTDLRGAIYWRNDKVTIAGEYEFRDFDFIVPPTDFFPGREFAFDANGVGLRAQFRLNDHVSLGLSGMQYDYNVDFLPDENRDAISLISVSRLSLINDLIDNRASIDIGIDTGTRHWGLDLSTWKSALDGSLTKSVTIHYLMPLSDRIDIEFGLGNDNSDLYGDVTFFSVFLYFYGGS